MKKLLISTALAALKSTVFAASVSTALVATMSTSAFAAKIGVSIVNFDNNFQTLLIHGMQDRAKEKDAAIQVEDAQNDVAKQLDQVKMLGGIVSQLPEVEGFEDVQHLDCGNPLRLRPELVNIMAVILR